MSTIVEKEFDYLVIGAGSGGIASARRAREFNVSVGVIEYQRLGGTCVSLLLFIRLSEKFLKRNCFFKFNYFNNKTNLLNKVLSFEFIICCHE